MAERIRTRASSVVRGSIHAVGQGRPRSNTRRQFTDEIITGKVTVPREIKSLGKFAVKLWKQTTSILISRGNFKLAHSMTVMLYCRAATVYFATPEEMAEIGELAVDPESGQPCESVSGVRHKAYQQMVKAQSLLGLDPLSELRTGLIEKKEEEKNAFLDI